MPPAGDSLREDVSRHRTFHFHLIDYRAAATGQHRPGGIDPLMVVNGSSWDA